MHGMQLESKGLKQIWSKSSAVISSLKKDKVKKSLPKRDHISSGGYWYVTTMKSHRLHKQTFKKTCMHWCLCGKVGIYNFQKLGTDFARMYCFKMAFSPSSRFFSKGSLGLTFLFSSNIHLKSWRCSSSEIGGRFLGSVTGETWNGWPITVAVELAGAVEVFSNPSPPSSPFSLLFVLTNR